MRLITLAGAVLAVVAVTVVLATNVLRPRPAPLELPARSALPSIGPLGSFPYGPLFSFPPP